MQIPLTIAIFRALQLGDLLCALPAIACVKRNYPLSRLYVIGLPHMESLLARYAFIDGFIAFPGYRGLPEQPEPSIETVEEFIQEMCTMRFDMVFQMHGDGTIVNDFLKRWEAKRLVGFCPDGLSADKDWMLYPDGLHEVDRHLRLLMYLGLSVSDGDRQLLFPLTEADWRSFSPWKDGLDRTAYAIVHVGSRDIKRQWPLANFKSLASYMHDQGLSIVLTGTEAEVELVNRMEQQLDFEVLNLAGKTDLGQLGCLVRKASLVLCNCTGISHIAAALKTRSIVISMDGEPERWGPINTELHHTYDGRQVLDLEEIKAVISQDIKSR